MPYSITTKDGITINNIPDDMPADHPELRQRVATIRGGSAPAPAAPAAAAPPPTVAAPTNGFAMGLRDPVDAGAQILRRIVPEGVGRAVDDFGNWLADKGLPVARSNGVEGVDNIVKGVNQAYDQQRQAAQPATLGGLVTGEREAPGFDWARLGGNLANPANYVGGGAVKGATTVGQLARGGAVAGGVSALLQPVVENTDNFWGAKAGQAALGAATGAIMTPAVAKGAEAAARGVQSLAGAARRVTATPEGIQIRVNNTFRSQGMNPAEVPEVIRNSVQRQVKEAIETGSRLDPAAMVRRAQFEAVGLVDDAGPTLGQMTRDPMQFANEKNLSGVRIRTPQGEGNPLADRFQRQNQRLSEVFDQVGARDATDRVTAGQSILDALRQADEPVRANVDELYTVARGMTGGRAAEIDRAAFSQAANENLDAGMWGRFVPPEIRGLLNDVTEGKTPFTVDAAEQIDGILSSAQRRAGRGSPEWSAIGVIRNALRDAPMAARTQAAATAESMAAQAGVDAARTVDEGVTDVTARMVNPTALPGQPQLAAPGSRAVAHDFEIPLQPPGRAVGPVVPPQAPPIDEGAAAREAFAQARQAARKRFATIESTPALAAALDNDAPDHFVRNYVLNADVRDVQAMRRVLENSPDALAQARAQIADHLKRAAFGENVSGDKAFTNERYLNTLRALGRQKLEVFFSPAEIVRLNLAGKVASDINSIPVGAKYGTNTSGTGAALMNLLSKISESPLLRKVPGARMIANQVGEIQTERAINNALSPAAAQPARELTPETVRALQLLFPASGVAGGVLGGSAVN